MLLNYPGIQTVKTPACKFGGPGFDSRSGQETNSDEEHKEDDQEIDEVTEEEHRRNHDVNERPKRVRRPPNWMNDYYCDPCSDQGGM